MAEDGKIIYKVVVDDSGAVKDAEAGGEKAGSSFGSKFSSALGTAGKIGAAAVGLVTTAAAAATTALIKAADGAAQYGDNIDKMSQKLGMSAEAYQEWDAIMQHSGTSIEAMQSSMKTLATAAEKNNDAFKVLGITEQELATMNQEELFSRTITALQEMESDTERTYIAGQLLGRGATELGALLNTSAEDTEAMRQRVHELGGVMSDEAVKAAAAYQDSLQDMQTAFQGLQRGMLSELLPGLTTVMDGLTELFAGDKDSGLALVSEGIDNIAEKITERLPQFIEVGLGIIEALATALLDNLPKLLEIGVSLVHQLGEAFLKGIPDMLDAGATLLENLLKGIDSESVAETTKTILTFIGRILYVLADHFDDLLDAGIRACAAIIDGIVQALTGHSVAELWQAFTNFVGEIVQFWKDKFSEWYEIGVAIVEGIKQGIADMWSDLVNSVTNWAGELWDSVCSFFGVASPSKKFKWLGEMSVEGTELGFEDKQAELTRTVRTVYADAGESAARALQTAMSGDFSTAGLARAVSYDINSSRMTNNIGGAVYNINVNGIEELDQMLNWFNSRELVGRMA